MEDVDDLFHRYARYQVTSLKGVNDDTTVGVTRQESQFLRLSNDLRLALHRVSELELEVLNSRDHSIGRTAEIQELKFRISKQAQNYNLRLHDQSVHDRNHRAHIGRLEEALVENTQLNLQLNIFVTNLRQEVATLRSSTAWKIGRLLTAPLRFLKR